MIDRNESLAGENSFNTSYNGSNIPFDPLSSPTSHFVARKLIQSMSPLHPKSPNSSNNNPTPKRHGNHLRSKAFERSPEGSQLYRQRSPKQSIFTPQQNQENSNTGTDGMEISPNNINNGLMSPPKISPMLRKQQTQTPYRKPLSPISPNTAMNQLLSVGNNQMEESPVASPNKIISPRRSSPLIAPSHRTSTLRKSPKSTLNRKSPLATPKQRTIQRLDISTSKSLLDQDRRFEEVIRVKPIQIETPTPSANDQSPQMIRSPFKTPSYYKRRQALAEDLSMAYDDSYSRSSKKEKTTQPFTPNTSKQMRNVTGIKNPFTPNSFKQIHVIPDKAYRMMVGNPNTQTTEPTKQPRKSIIRSMKDYRKNKLESIKNKLRDDSQANSQSNQSEAMSDSPSNNQGDKKRRGSGGKKRKFDETDEELQGGATVLSTLGTLTSDTPAVSASVSVDCEDLINAVVDVESDGESEDEVVVTHESPTKKIKSEQGKPLWTRLKRALTKKKPAPVEEPKPKQSVTGPLKRKLSKKSLVQKMEKNSQLALSDATNTDGPLRKQHSFGETYFGDVLGHRTMVESQVRSSTMEDVSPNTKLRNRQFQLQDDLERKLQHSMLNQHNKKMQLMSADPCREVRSSGDLISLAIPEHCFSPSKLPTLNLKNASMFAPSTTLEEKATTVQQPTSSDQKEFNYNFVETINTPHHREYFIKYCQKEYSGENIEFWCHVKLKYVFWRTRSQRLEHAIQLLNEFVEVSAEKALNIDQKSILKVRTRIQQNDPNDDLVDLFDTITRHIETVMTDSFKRFQLSPQYQEMVSHHKQLLQTRNTSTDLYSPRGANFKNKVFGLLMSPRMNEKK